MFWHGSKGGVSEKMVHDVESKLGVSFPDDFVDVVKMHDGGNPVPNRITVNGREEVLNNIVSFKEEDDSYILGIIDDVGCLLASSLIPIAEDPFGNLFCYQFTESETSIVFYDHELQERIMLAYSTFSELMAGLH